MSLRSVRSSGLRFKNKLLFRLKADSAGDHTATVAGIRVSKSRYRRKLLSSLRRRKAKPGRGERRIPSIASL